METLSKIVYCLVHREKFLTHDDVENHKNFCKMQLISVKKSDQRYFDPLIFDSLVDDRLKIHAP